MVAGIEDWAPRALWTASSGKVGHEVGQLVHDDTGTFWQSEGQLPHALTAQFPHAMSLSEVEIFIDLSMDESYTPLEMLIRLGPTLHDLHDLHVLEMEDPKGWLRIPLTDRDGATIPVHVLQLVVLSNYQDGRDSRIRCVRTWGEAYDAAEEALDLRTLHIDAVPGELIR